jgi:hypothetical protein
MSTSEDEFPREGLAQYEDVITAVCIANDSPDVADLMLALVQLEPRHRNRHGYGAKAGLRREIEALLEPWLPTS